ncbi:MAG: hypothetical protein LBL96_00725 [Clostridiales bacterium]|jgi:hypothetical protein|nr:hypothetical protein [Clostridiales bacterium]
MLLMGLHLLVAFENFPTIITKQVLAAAAVAGLTVLALSEPSLDTDDTTPVDINAAARLFILSG